MIPPSVRVLLLASALSLIAPSAEAQHSPGPIPIRFARRATSTTMPVALRPGESAREYGVYARVGQSMTVAVASTGSPAAFSIACPGCRGAGASFRAFSQAGRWNGILPASGGYVIRLASTTPGQRMTLSVAIAPAASRAAPGAGSTMPAGSTARPTSPTTKPGVSAGGARPIGRGTAEATAPAASTALPEPLRSALPRLRSRSGVPILLPGEIPAEVERPLYAIATGSANGYRVTLTHAPGCDAHACNAGYIDAERGRRAHGSQRVRLADGTTAFFTPMSCGASCSDPRLEWERNGVAYGLEMALPGPDAQHRAVLSRLAASALRAGPR
jgi:hypothetical protein